MNRKAVVKGVGHYLPKRVVENAEFEETLETSDEWIRARTGIERRHISAPDETTSFMGTKAAQAALAMAGADIKDVDAIILATSTADHTFPSAATMVQQGLGMNHGFAFDVQAVCAGFVYALTTAKSMIESGQANSVMVIGAEMFSKLMDWTDRGTCVLFGDGAGALYLEAETDTDRGILSSQLASDGQYKDILFVDGGVSMQTTGHLRMQGKEVFRHAVEKLSDTAVSSLADAGLTPADVTWVVPHQANRRILEGVSKRLKIPMDQFIVTVQDHGNTSAASIPLALARGAAEGRFKPGDVLVIGAIGGGLAWGTAVLRW